MGCIVTDCPGEHRARGYCNAHYKRLIRHGSAYLGGRSRLPKGEVRRFYSEVVLPYDGDECLTWPHARDKDGYARLNVAGRSKLVSRLVCEERYGPPPTAEHEAAHSCGKGEAGCVAGRHLSWKTHVGNQADKLIHGTIRRGERASAAKLSASNVAEIRKMLGAGDLLHREIAASFGVSRQVIGSIANGKSWVENSP